jgi:DNA-binding ferritin-like protein (Dps family)
MTQFAEDAKHLFIVGATQTGKTTTAKEIFAESSRVGIWVNDRGKHQVEGVRTLADGSYRSLRGIKKAFFRDETRIEYLPADRREGLSDLTDWLWTVADRTDRDLPVSIFVDEMHKVAPQSQKDELVGRDDVRTITKEGEKRNIKMVGISQDPVSFDKQSLRQRNYLLCYELAREQTRYLRDYGVDVEEINAQAEFSGVLYNRSGRVAATSVKAKSRYA